jgi:hypothetical protein
MKSRRLPNSAYRGIAYAAAKERRARRKREMDHQDMLRADDARRVINGLMTHAEYAAKWPDSGAN